MVVPQEQLIINYVAELASRAGENGWYVVQGGNTKFPPTPTYYTALPSVISESKYFKIPQIDVPMYELPPNAAGQPTFYTILDLAILDGRDDVVAALFSSTQPSDYKYVYFTYLMLVNSEYGQRAQFYSVIEFAAMHGKNNIVSLILSLRKNPNFSKWWASFDLGWSFLYKFDMDRIDSAPSGHILALLIHYNVAPEIIVEFLRSVDVADLNINKENILYDHFFIAAEDIDALCAKYNDQKLIDLAVEKFFIKPRTELERVKLYYILLKFKVDPQLLRKYHAKFEEHDEYFPSSRYPDSGIEKLIPIGNNDLENSKLLFRLLVQKLEAYIKRSAADKVDIDSLTRNSLLGAAFDHENWYFAEAFLDLLLTSPVYISSKLFAFNAYFFGQLLQPKSDAMINNPNYDRLIGKLLVLAARKADKEQTEEISKHIANALGINHTHTGPEERHTYENRKRIIRILEQLFANNPVEYHHFALKLLQDQEGYEKFMSLNFQILTGFFPLSVMTIAVLNSQLGFGEKKETFLNKLEVLALHLEWIQHKAARDPSILEHLKDNASAMEIDESGGGSATLTYTDEYNISHYGSEALEKVLNNIKHILKANGRDKSTLEQFAAAPNRPTRGL